MIFGCCSSLCCQLSILWRDMVPCLYKDILKPGQKAITKPAHPASWPTRMGLP
jgi:hypothetical protein